MKSMAFFRSFRKKEKSNRETAASWRATRLDDRWDFGGSQRPFTPLDTSPPLVHHEPRSLNMSCYESVTASHCFISTRINAHSSSLAPRASTEEIEPSTLALGKERIPVDHREIYDLTDDPMLPQEDAVLVAAAICAKETRGMAATSGDSEPSTLQNRRRALSVGAVQGAMRPALRHATSSSLGLPSDLPPLSAPLPRRHPTTTRSLPNSPTPSRPCSRIVSSGHGSLVSQTSNMEQPRLVLKRSMPHLAGVWEGFLKETDEDATSPNSNVGTPDQETSEHRGFLKSVKFVYGRQENSLESQPPLSTHSRVHPVYGTPSPKSNPRKGHRKPPSQNYRSTAGLTPPSTPSHKSFTHDTDRSHSHRPSPRYGPAPLSIRTSSVMSCTHPVYSSSAPTICMDPEDLSDDPFRFTAPSRSLTSSPNAFVISLFPTPPRSPRARPPPSPLSARSSCMEDPSSPAMSSASLTDYETPTRNVQHLPPPGENTNATPVRRRRRQQRSAVCLTPPVTPESSSPEFFPPKYPAFFFRQPMVLRSRRALGADRSFHAETRSEEPGAGSGDASSETDKFERMVLSPRRPPAKPDYRAMVTPVQHGVDATHFESTFESHAPTVLGLRAARNEKPRSAAGDDAICGSSRTASVPLLNHGVSAMSPCAKPLYPGHEPVQWGYAL